MSTIEKALQKQQAKEKSSIEMAADKLAQAQEQQNAAPAPAEPVAETAAESAPVTQSETKVEQPADVEQTSAPAESPAAPVVETTQEAAPAAKSPAPISLQELQKGFVSNQGRNIINEEFRAIKRKVLSNAFGPLSKTLTNSNIIMVTSPNPNEGKTFTAINLALSIALEQDKTVLLVDADVLRPSVMKTINQPFENGLMEYLLGDVDDLSQVIHHTSLDTLRIIPAGKTHHLSTELLASEKMLETVNDFANRYSDRVVIFDTPPLLGINETAILANLAGQAVVVVHEGKTSLTRVSQAVDQLNPNMAKGFVINKAKKPADDGTYYGYYYGRSDSEK